MNNQICIILLQQKIIEKSEVDLLSYYMYGIEKRRKLRQFTSL